MYLYNNAVAPKGRHFETELQQLVNLQKNNRQLFW